jgi:predicted RNase H-like nuclease (RuvC/YqgF family)
MSDVGKYKGKGKRQRTSDSFNWEQTEIVSNQDNLINDTFKYLINAYEKQIRNLNYENEDLKRKIEDLKRKIEDITLDFSMMKSEHTLSQLAYRTIDNHVKRLEAINETKLKYTEMIEGELQQQKTKNLHLQVEIKRLMQKLELNHV